MDNENRNIEDQIKSLCDRTSARMDQRILEDLFESHAVTLSVAAQTIAVLPNGVMVSPRSSRIRASTGNAVMP